MTQIAAGSPAGNRVPGSSDSPADALEDSDHPPFGRLAVAAILLFWLLQFVWFSVDRYLRAPQTESFETLFSRLVVTGAGVGLSFLILQALRRSVRLSFLKRALLAIALALAGATVNSIVNRLVFWVVVGPAPGEPPPLSALGEYLPTLVYFFSWFYLALSLILLSLTYGEELLVRERRIVELRADADRATLAALRYQLNPHFLFNALNSAASLVSSGRSREAEAMLENLADFLRATLELDAQGEITLGEELALQSLYLQVEMTRFPNRLRVEQHVPPELKDVLVPSLITQPLIENAIKHSVARSARQVRIRLSANAADGRLHIEIGDDGGDSAASRSGGTGIGLRNVANRLRLHFGDEGDFHAGPAEGAGYFARMSMPLRRRR